MPIEFERNFDRTAVERAYDYVAKGYVLSVEAAGDGLLQAVVRNASGARYTQTIKVNGTFARGGCTCPVGANCKHVAAALIEWERRGRPGDKVRTEVTRWLSQIDTFRLDTPSPDARPEDYPPSVKDRLLYVLSHYPPELSITPYKGHINSAGTAFNKSIRRYDVLQALRSTAPAQFLRPVDLDILSELSRAQIWETPGNYLLPAVIRNRHVDIASILRRLAATGRFLLEDDAEAVLTWSETRVEARLNWVMTPDGKQVLKFTDEMSSPIDLRSRGGVAFWFNRKTKELGEVMQPLGEEILRLVNAAPALSAADIKPVVTSMPERLAGLPIPRPHLSKNIRRDAERKVPKLTLSAASAKDGPTYWASSVKLPALKLEFVYDGVAVSPFDRKLPHILENEDVITLSRDEAWEQSCMKRLMEADAIPVEDLQNVFPSEKLLQSDYVFSDGEDNIFTQRLSREKSALDFTFTVIPQLREEGWDIHEDLSWPYHVSHQEAQFVVQTQHEKGQEFLSNDWFSFGFEVHIGNKKIDAAQVIAEALKQIRQDFEEIPPLDDLRFILQRSPIYTKQGRSDYIRLDLAPIADLLHMFLRHQVELGVMHPSEALTAWTAERALEGSNVRFEDSAGILPLAQKLQSLSDVATNLDIQGFSGRLRDYQAVGTNWMARILGAGFGGILADDMGLGKTIQTLALLQARKESGISGPTLLIVPTSLLHSWETQAAQFTPSLRVVTLHGKERSQLRDQALASDVVLTTYPLLARDAEWLAASQWPLVIIDEAQTLKNPASQMAKTLRDIPAKGRLALTGTPLENSLQDLWTLVDWVNPGLLGNRKRFQEVFQTPIERHGDQLAQARLNRRLKPFMLRRTKESVATELPPKTEIIDRVDLPKAQQALYESVRSAMDERVREAVRLRGLSGAHITVLDALLKLRQVCCDPQLVKTEVARSVTESAKRSRLRDLLTELVAEGRRVLVFSQFVEMLRLIEGDLEKAAIPYLTLTGETKDRAAVLDAFSRGEASVFLLSLKAGGVGLTLTEADSIILYDPWWNPAVERQAMDRAHRIGQDKPVFVYRLVAAGTVEEKIINMQSRKQALADALFSENGNAASGLLDDATLTELFSPITA